MRYCLFHIFAIFSNGRGSHFGYSICEKIVIASCEDLCDTILVLIHSEVLESVFHEILAYRQNRASFVVVVVVLLFYVHRKHLRSCRDGQLT